MNNLKYPKTNSRKDPCEICGVSSGSHHKTSCKWAFNPRPTLKANPQKSLFRIHLKNRSNTREHICWYSGIDPYEAYQEGLKECEKKLDFVVYDIKRI